MTYRKAGEDHGYFATPDDAEIFEHELTWMLLHQVFSFNSPVWFNVGTAVAAAGQRLLHPRRRRLDGLDPQLVQGGGADLQGRLRRRPQPVPHPLLQGAAVLRRHRLRPGLASCAAPTRPRAPSSPVAPPGARPRWSSSTSTTPTSRSSSRPRRARRTRSARCATPASTWTSAARTSSASSTRTPTTRSGSPTSSCARSRRAASSGCAAALRRRGHRDRRRPRAVPQDRPGRVGVRRPGHPVRRHDQRLAHQPRDRPDHRVQPVLGVHVTSTTPRATWPRSTC